MDVSPGNKIVPRYLFEFSSRKDVVPDTIGTDLDSLRAAHLHALILIEKTVRFISDVADWRGWRVVITDAETNQRLLTVLFPARGLAARSAFKRRTGDWC